MCNSLQSQTHIDDFLALVEQGESGFSSYRIQHVESKLTGNAEPKLKWYNGRPTGPSPFLQDLQNKPPCAIRIIFSQSDEPSPSNLEELRAIFERFSFPTVFLKERVQGVTNSFGRRNTDLVQDSWFHFLCKNIVRKDSDPSFDVHHPTSGQENPSWIQGGFFLQQEKSNGNITLICFGPFPKLKDRLERFIESTDNVQSTLLDPYALHVIILDELHLKMDSIIWDLISTYNQTEMQIFQFAGAQQNGSSRGYDVDFVRLHHLMKLIIHLKEGCEAIIEMVKSMKTAHDDSFGRDNALHPSISTTKNNLDYLLSSFSGLSLRVRSVETRASNMINLGFNLVIQRDSTFLQEDSQSMKTVAIMTLVFLPGTAVASVFGSQFFNADFSDSGNGHMKVSSDFWIFWILAATVTALTLIGWWIWLTKSSTRRFAPRIAERRPRGVASVA